VVGVLLMTRLVGIWASVMLLTACASIPVSVQLVPEERTTLHVGEIGALSIPPTPHYSVGSTQASLLLLKTIQRAGHDVYLYRAVSTGNDTFVLTPVGRQDAECISCVTVHYFVTVVP
jgi:hypothetical protein